jgi:hypothetical protein
MRTTQLGPGWELAEELAALYAQARGRSAGTADPVAVERALAALVTLAHKDRTALRDALRPVLTRYKITPEPRDWTKAERLLSKVTGYSVLPWMFSDLPHAGNHKPAEFAELKARDC